jgi:hypothetical protein
MSILIKGMEMPKSCYKCPMRRRDGMDIVCPVAHERFSVADVNILDYRLDRCPLVPVPPHGRLIDADALKVSLAFAEKTADWAVPALRAVLMVIDEMPTIIPAEEGE